MVAVSDASVAAASSLRIVTVRSDNRPRYPGLVRSPKASMPLLNRRAQHNNLAPYRAELVFRQRAAIPSSDPTTISISKYIPAAMASTQLQQRVRAGIFGASRVGAA